MSDDVKAPRPTVIFEHEGVRLVRLLKGETGDASFSAFGVPFLLETRESDAMGAKRWLACGPSWYQPEDRSILPFSTLLRALAAAHDARAAPPSTSEAEFVQSGVPLQPGQTERASPAPQTPRPGLSAAALRDLSNEVQRRVRTWSLPRDQRMREGPGLVLLSYFEIRSALDELIARRVSGGGADGDGQGPCAICSRMYDVTDSDVCIGCGRTFGPCCQGGLWEEGWACKECGEQTPSKRKDIDKARGAHQGEVADSEVTDWPTTYDPNKTGERRADPGPAALVESARVVDPAATPKTGRQDADKPAADTVSVEASRACSSTPSQVASAPRDGDCAEAGDSTALDLQIAELDAVSRVLVNGNGAARSYQLHAGEVAQRAIRTLRLVRDQASRPSAPAPPVEVYVGVPLGQADSYLNVSATELERLRAIEKAAGDCILLFDACLAMEPKSEHVTNALRRAFARAPQQEGQL